MNFDEWWSENWTRMTGQPAIMNLAFKEIAQNAWNAAIENAKKPGKKRLKSNFVLPLPNFTIKENDDAKTSND